MIFSELFVLMGMIICFLDGPLVVMLNLGLPFGPILLVTLCISIIFSEDSLGKASLISLISPLETCAYDLLFDFGAKFDDWFFS